MKKADALTGIHYPCRAKRIAAGLTVAEVAKRLRVTTSYLSRCERRGFTQILRERAYRMGVYPGCGRKDFLPHRAPTPSLPAPASGSLNP